MAALPRTKPDSANKQLGAFLRQRRERLGPADVGLPATRRRRTPGLRREEVAELAGISVDWYVRLEQGRESFPSKATAESLARALRLSAPDRLHLLRLSAEKPERAFRRETVPPELVRLVAEIPTPAYIIGARFDLLCWNRASVRVFGDFGKIPEPQRNTLYQMFAGPGARKSHPDWEADARYFLERFRVAYDFWAHAPEFVGLKDELCSLSDEFRRWWKAHEIRPKASGDKVLNHAGLGRIRLHFAAFQLADNPDLRLILHGPPKPDR
ncbi:MAG TPA: helix-turn-helix transcriptional regulator [Opitutaceae bacterium]